MLKEYLDLLREIKKKIDSAQQEYNKVSAAQKEIEKKKKDIDDIASAVLGMLGEDLEGGNWYDQEYEQIEVTLATIRKYDRLKVLSAIIKHLVDGKDIPPGDAETLKALYKSNTEEELRNMIDMVALAVYVKLIKKRTKATQTYVNEMNVVNKHLQSSKLDANKKKLVQAQWAMGHYYAFAKEADAGKNKELSWGNYQNASKGLGAYRKQVMDENVSLRDAFEVDYRIRAATKGGNLLSTMLDVLLAQKTDVTGRHINASRQKLINNVLAKAANEHYDLDEFKEKIINLANISGMSGEDAYEEYEKKQKEFLELEERALKAQREAEERARKRALEAEERAKKKAIAEKERAQRIAQEAAERARIEEIREKKLQEEIPYIQRYLREDKLHLQYWDKKWVEMDPTGDLQVVEECIIQKVSQLIRAGLGYTRDSIKSEIKDYYEKNYAKYVVAYYNYCYEKVSLYYEKNIEKYIRGKVKRIPGETPEKNLEEYIARFIKLCNDIQVINYIKQLVKNRDNANDLTGREMRGIFEYIEDLVRKSYNIPDFPQMGARDYRIPWAMALYAMIVVTGGFDVCDLFANAVPGEMINVLGAAGYMTVALGGAMMLGTFWDVYHYVNKVSGKLGFSYYLTHIVFTAALTFVTAVILLIGGNSLLLLLSKLVLSFVMFCCSLIGMKMGSRPKVEKKS